MAGHERPAQVQKWLDPSAPFETLKAEQQEAITAACTLLEEFAQASPEVQGDVPRTRHAGAPGPQSKPRPRSTPTP